MNEPVDRQKPTGLTRMFRAFGASMKGFTGAYREEAAFRQELALAVVVIPLGLWLGRNGIERVLLIAQPPLPHTITGSLSLPGNAARSAGR